MIKFFDRIFLFLVELNFKRIFVHDTYGKILFFLVGIQYVARCIKFTRVQVTRVLHEVTRSEFLHHVVNNSHVNLAHCCVLVHFDSFYFPGNVSHFEKSSLIFPFYFFLSLRTMKLFRHENI